MTKISLDFMFANTSMGQGKTYEKTIQDETQKFIKEPKEIQKRMIAYYQQQSTSFFLHKADQRYYKKLLLEALKHEKA